MAQRWERALVTGASSGIGRSIALELASRGTPVVLVARRQSMLEDVAHAIATEHNGAVEILVADLLTAEGLDTVDTRLRSEDSPIDLLVNNAGFGTFGSFHKLPVGREEDEVRLNISALLRLSHAAAATMVSRGRGGIMNVGSTAGFQPMAFSTTYSSTKAFVNTFSQALHEELKPHGVHVSVLAPGYVRTEFQDVAELSASVIPNFAWLDVDRVARIGLNAVDKNKAVAVTGGMYKTAIGLNRVLPRSVVRGMTRAGAARRIAH